MTNDHDDQLYNLARQRPRLLAANSGFAPGHHALRKLTERLGQSCEAQGEELTTRLARQKGQRRYPETWEAWSLGDFFVIFSRFVFLFAF